VRRIFIALSAGATVLVAALSAPAPAGASTVTHGRLLQHQTSASSGEKSSNWSGDVVTGGTYTRVTGSWVVPKVKVTKTNRFAADWVGIGGYSTGDLVQSGTAEQSVNGHASYYAWTEILPASESRLTGFSVHPGDSITDDVDQVSSGSWVITVTNHTTGAVAITNLQYASTQLSAEWIHEAPTVGSGQARLASTSNAVFDLGTVNGSTPIGTAGTLHEIQLVGATDATPSALDGDQDGFAVADGRSAPKPPTT
jgi:hypothetical protein